MAITSAGVGSGLDVNSIVSQLMQIEQQPLSALNRKEASYQAKMTAYGTLKGAVSTFQTAVQGLTNPSTFTAFKANISDATVGTASATSTATAGSYAINVSKVAQSQSLVAVGQTSTTAAIGTGATTTLTFDFGTISGGTLTAYNPATGTGGTYAGATFTSSGSGAKTITIDSSNNTLAGIRDAINAANIGVKASIVNDGSGTPYRLVLASSSTGLSNSVKVSVSGDATLASLLGNDPAGTQNLQETITAQNTEMTVNGVFVSKSGTAVTDAIEGVTFTALKTGSTNLTVAQDSSATSTAVSGFVKAYNDLNTTLKNLTSYNADTKEAAILLGDAATRTIQNQLRSMLGSSITGSGTYSTLSQIGISVQKDGTLALDSSKLQSALSTNSKDVAALFAVAGKTSDSLVSYTSSTSNTQAGSYALNVSQLATQGALVGSAAAGLTITAGVNDTLSVTVDGIAATVTLAAKTYSSAADLALEVQSKINGASSLTAEGIGVTVSQAGGVMTITSKRYGSASEVAFAGNAASNLIGGAPVATKGVDVTGTINGIAATGSGQYLTGAKGSSSEGLKLLINGGVTGDRGTVTFSQGYASRLNSLLDNMLGSTGPISSATDGVNRTIKDLEARREVLNRRLSVIEARYRKQYTALDSLISSMNQTSTYLTQQLASLSKSTG